MLFQFLSKNFSNFLVRFFPSRREAKYRPRLRRVNGLRCFYSRTKVSPTSVSASRSGSIAALSRWSGSERSSRPSGKVLW